MLKKSFLIIVLLVGVVSLSSFLCISQKNDAYNVQKLFLSMNIEKEQKSNPIIEDDKLEEKFFEMGKLYREELDNNDSNNVIITVNGMEIKKSALYMQKNLIPITGGILKNEIIKIVRHKVEICEARRKKIEPLQEELDLYFNQIRESYDSSVAFAFYRGMGFKTADEYIEFDKEKQYEYLQLVAFARSINKNIDYDTYVDDLVRKADIEILDDEIKVILESRN